MFEIEHAVGMFSALSPVFSFMSQKKETVCLFCRGEVPVISALKMQSSICVLKGVDAWTGSGKPGVVLCLSPNPILFSYFCCNAFG